MLAERRALQEYAEKIIESNKEIERELDSFVNIDDSIVKTLEQRDLKFSPVLKSYLHPPNRPLR
jgi:hypothetical protein